MLKKLQILLLIFAGATIFANETAAQQPTPQREKPPAGAAPKPFIFPTPENFALANGMTVSLVQYGTVPKVTIEARVRTGRIDEAANQTYLSILTAETLKEGTKSRTGADISRAAAEMGGSLNVYAGADQTIASGSVLSEFDQKFVELIADVLQNPVFPAADLERIKNDKLREIAVAKAEPGAIANEKFRQILFADHAYGRVYPTNEQLAAYKVADVQAFYNQNFGAKRTHLYVVGKFDQKAMRAQIERAFANFKAGAAPTVNVPKTTAARSLTVIDRPDAPQSTLYIGLPVIDPTNPDYIKFAVTNALLGGAFGSRITSNIREQKGYTYSPYSYVTNRFRTSYWLQVADVTTAVTGASLKEIFYEIERLQKEPPSAAELDGIKNNLAGLFVIQNSTRNGVIAQLDEVNFQGLDKSYIDNYVTRILAVTAQDVQQTAQKYVRPDKMTIVVVGDKSKIADQIAVYEKK